MCTFSAKATRWVTWGLSHTDSLCPHNLQHLQTCLSPPLEDYQLILDQVTTIMCIYHKHPASPCKKACLVIFYKYGLWRSAFAYRVVQPGVWHPLGSTFTPGVFQIGRSMDETLNMQKSTGGSQKLVTVQTMYVDVTMSDLLCTSRNARVLSLNRACARSTPGLPASQKASSTLLHTPLSPLLSSLFAANICRCLNP